MDSFFSFTEEPLAMSAPMVTGEDTELARMDDIAADRLFSDELMSSSSCWLMNLSALSPVATQPVAKAEYFGSVHDTIDGVNLCSPTAHGGLAAFMAPAASATHGSSSPEPSVGPFFGSAQTSSVGSASPPRPSGYFQVEAASAGAKVGKGKGKATRASKKLSPSPPAPSTAPATSKRVRRPAPKVMPQKDASPEYDDDVESMSPAPRDRKRKRGLSSGESDDSDSANNGKTGGGRLGQITMAEVRELVAKGLPAYLCKDNLTTEEERELKRQRRLIRNRESAHNSRRRRKDHIDGLQAQLEALRAENAGLRQRVADLETHSTAVQSELDHLHARMKEAANVVESSFPSLKLNGHVPIRAASVCLMVMLFSFGLFFQSGPEPFALAPHDGLLEQIPSATAERMYVGRVLKSLESTAAVPQPTPAAAARMELGASGGLKAVHFAPRRAADLAELLPSKSHRGAALAAAEPADAAVDARAFAEPALSSIEMAPLFSLYASSGAASVGPTALRDALAELDGAPPIIEITLPDGGGGGCGLRMRCQLLNTTVVPVA